MSGTHTYLNKLSTIRPYLRLLATGRIHVSDFPTKKFRDNRIRLHHFLKEIKRRKKKVGRKDYENLSTDSYMNNNNYLIDLYRTKSFTKEEISSLLLLLQIINKNTGKEKNGISNLDIIDSVTEKLSNEAAVVNTIEGHTNYLYRNRIICRDRKNFISNGKKKTANLYYFNDNPLAGLTEEEYRELVLAIGFYKNISLLSIFGYFLETKLMDMYHKKKLPMIPVQFHRRSMVNIIDEEIIYQLSFAKHTGRLAQIKYRKRSDASLELKDKIYPIEIQERFLHGDRQFLICLPYQDGNWSSHLLTLPLENIDDVKIISPLPKDVPNNIHQDKEVSMSLRLYYDSNEKKENLLTKIKNRSNQFFIESEQILYEEYCCMVNIQTEDPNAFIPFVQSNYPDIIVVNAPENIISRIKFNIEETLKYYE